MTAATESRDVRGLWASICPCLLVLALSVGSLSLLGTWYESVPLALMGVLLAVHARRNRTRLATLSLGIALIALLIAGAVALFLTPTQTVGSVSVIDSTG